ncbi:MAG: SDR family oxidoreductase [Sphingomonadaceae bacterium]|uniref:SDR family NAD(P)-dependent oxidoreductase n=1 Tax=Thermaurantiacus sp. TaxID=2820283 RepID=UPI00298F19EE|nr:SDR family NAD(P)-dependent oxidoreductase [Thermaurantiacus sp.]MCS6987197.1 SDR family oxidoreductase [Sphingomonadaceae bacterium]MDW8415769.1 SDR family NAD(P)-dependent oxidoreductase [Thermaurantiacus sp.]
MSGRFAGRVVVVTGSGRRHGLGAAIVRRFAQEGAACVVSDLGVPKDRMGEGDIGTTAEMEEVAAEVRALGADAIAVPCDVRLEADCQALVATTVERFGRLDVMVANAGIGYLMKPFLDTEEADWDAVLDVNLKGAFLCARHAAAHMVARGGGGRILMIASQAAKSGFPHMAPYCASKHGMVGLVRALAVELGPHGITVNAVCPNHVTTGLGAKQNAYFSQLLGFPSVEAYLEAMARRIPMGRPGLPEDTAAVCAFLASDEALYVTGEAWNVSGGEEVH